MICPKCGFNCGNANFCPACGAPLRLPERNSSANQGETINRCPQSVQSAPTSNSRLSATSISPEDAQKEAALELKRQNKVARQRKREIASNTVVLPLAAGISLPEKTRCTIVFYANVIQIFANGTEFDLPMQKVHDISIKTDIERHDYIASSVGGAVMGGLLFGPIGAAIGGRVKTQTTVKFKKYLIITYVTNKGASYIAFHVTGLYSSKAKELVKKFRPYTNQSGHITL